MKKSKTILLVISIIMCTMFLMIPKAFAQEVSVDIVSFARGAQTDLRASELLEARVTGYSGNVLDLQYEWSTTQNTYLYLYYSHNMYSIMNTGGEVEISKNSTPVRRQGYAWAAIYTADASMSDLLGTITVKVYDTDGNLLASDSHTGTREQTGGSIFWPTYTYSGFVEDDLNADLESVAFGMFEGDTKNALSLLGEAGIVHIDCPKSTLTDGYVKSGTEYLSMTDNKITALKPGSATSGGDAIVSLSVEKDYCKFHSYSSGDADVPVYVFKRPVPVAGATTITITADSTDDRVEYYIEGVKGTKQSDGTVIFTNLTPNTTYEIMAKGQVQDTKPVYAYVNATTLPTYTATINVYLDTVNASHTRMSITDILGANAKVAIKKQNSSEYIVLTEAAEGIYTTTNIDSGTYYPSYSIDGTNYVDLNREMIVTSADASIDFHFYQVEYDLNGGDGNVVQEANYLYGTSVNVTSESITKEGYSFAGFKDQDGNTYALGSVLTTGISKAYKLTAQWTAKMDEVIVNVTVDHVDEQGTGKKEYTIGEILKLQLTHQLNDGEPYTDVVGKTQQYTLVEKDYNNDTFKYTFATFTDLSSLYKYSANVTLDGYYVSSKVVEEVTTDGKTTYTVDIVLKYRPDLLDLTFDVIMKEGTPASLKPVSAEVKVTSWYDTDNNGTNEWATIAQHKETTITVPIDGDGTYTVWQWFDKENRVPYYYRLEVISVELSDGTIIMMNDSNIYSYEVVVKDGNTPSGQLLNGVYGVETADDTYTQQGTLTAIIDVKSYSVTLNPNGGTFSDNSTNNVIIDELLTMPDISGYSVSKDGYTFDGWYLDDGTTIAQGEKLTSDVTLYAKWKEKLTVEGQIAVSGTYLLNGNTHTIPNVDRIKNVTVLLQKIADGHAITVEHKTIAITYNGNIGYGNYSFTDIIDDGTSYRIAISSVNYDVVFQHEPDSLTKKDDFDSYNENAYLAVMGTVDVSTATVNAYLHFAPSSFELKYNVDATAIGEGFRPTLAEVLVLYDDGSNDSNPQNWAVISQMIFNGTILGQDTTLTNGLGNNIYHVWKYKPDGISLYDYAVLLNKYVMADGHKLTYDASKVPFWAHYNGSARFDDENNQTNLLTITLTPHIYNVKLDVGFTQTENDYVTGMDTYSVQHTWSYKTDVSGYVPSRDGYEFAGWYDEDGNKVTEVSADTARNVVLTARWIAVMDEVIVNVTVDHVDEQGTGKKEYTIGEILKLQLTHQLNDGEPYTDVVGKTQQYTLVEKDYNNDTFKYTFDTFTDLSSLYKYSANVTLDGYYVSSKVVEEVTTDGKTTYTVDIVLKYRPDLLDLNFNVVMKEGTPASLKPVSAEVKVTSWYDTDNNGTNEWATIAQHKETTVTVPIDGDGTYTVWQWFDKENKVPYYYRLEVISVELSDGTIIMMNDSNIYSYEVVVKDGSAPSGQLLNGVYGVETADDTYTQQGTLTAVIDVKHYTVTLNSTIGKFSDNTVTKTFVEQIKMPNIANLIPYVDGYTFAGWEGNLVTTDAYLTENIILNAKWTPIVYNIVYILDGGRFETTDIPITYTIEDQITLPVPVRNEYIFMGWYEDSDFGGNKVTEIPKGSFGDKTFYAHWEKDVIGGGLDGNEPDNIPDKYQKKVIFKIENGTWDGTDKEDKVFYVTLTDEAGNWSETGKATITVPTGMKANYGYENGAWDLTPTTIVSGTETAIYTYSYTKIGDKEVTYNKDEEVDVPYGEYIIVDPNGGSWTHEGTTYTEKETFKIEDNMIIGDATRVDYIFMGWERTEGEDEIKYIFTAIWEKDVVGGGPDGNEPDNIPDKYQKKVIFKIENGTWDGTDKEDKVFYVTLTDEAGNWSETGKATIIVPTGMKANYGYENGAWDVIPNAEVEGTNTEEFTYSYTEIPEIPNTVDSVYHFIITCGLSFVTLLTTLILSKRKKEQY